jgi:diguanylate cyclase (GGDEF)-like protein/PAS domain S-box-containing protein
VGPWSLFVAQILLYSAFPFAFTLFRKPQRLLLSYVFIAVVLGFGGFMGSIYALPLADGLIVSAGSILYGALVLASLLAVVTARDSNVVRNIIKVVIAVNVFKVGVLAVTSTALRNPVVINRFDTSPDVFDVSLLVVALGGVLIIAELVLLLMTFEALKTHVRSGLTLALACVAFYIAVLCLDGVLFPLLAAPTSPDLSPAISAGLKSKLVIATAFSGPLLLYLLVFRRDLAAYREVPLRLQELFFAPRTDLVEELERQSHVIAQSAERYRQLVESTADAVTSLTVDGVVTGWNRAAAELYGYSTEGATGRPITDLVPADRVEEVQGLISAVASDGVVLSLEMTAARPDGSTVDVALTISPVLDSQGRVVAVSTIGRDVSERRRFQRRLEHQAQHDPLTGLPNRALLLERLQRLDHTPQEGTALEHAVAVLFIDLDQFKMVNDASGHHAGDLLLVQVAHRLSHLARSGDTVARFGGDEYVVLCTDTGIEQALTLARDVLTVLSEPFEVVGRRAYVSASVGVAVSAPNRSGDLLRQADVAMYEAKARGRGRVQLFDDSLDERAQGKLALAGDLQDALAAGDLALHYQPVVDLRTGTVRGVEALIRWAHHERGMVPPNVFIPLAEDTGLITAIDRWALARGCHDGARLLSAGVLPADAHIAVNLSAHDIADSAVEQTIDAAIRDAGPAMTYRNLMVEVTETVVIRDLAHSRRVLNAIRALGADIAIDDFGTGHSSLTYLRLFPAQHVKIDRSFIRGIAENPQDLAIVRSVVELAHAIGLETIAEGVETLEQCTLLTRLGCDAAQGYLWSPALPIDEFCTLVAELPGGQFSTIVPS